ncbi:hypothetical protein CUS07_04860 [Enterococcus faecalis]|nr:hypothetical protein [Enterococcus faecalis]PQE34190.1 hypothetical protein CUS33_13830 [Enterococcus faecalis]PQE60376.1 hypothetical protein CUS07_04860 [Enterococcus faecalis]PQE65734.1 hypothetical protein CUS03_09640 [Enterococcus faecalis]PQE96910.1 hypothetical protein CUS90_12220 [Enterococcus faecalis]
MVNKSEAEITAGSFEGVVFVQLFILSLNVKESGRLVVLTALPDFFLKEFSFERFTFLEYSGR